jgi:NAD(P)-dependent dehydrogenase (short-subunit alcohol dehydrogenase family)
MSKSDSPVAIVTGAGRGLGREHALALARAGYAVVVNDLGGAGDGTGADATPAGQVVAEIEAMGGRAAADGSDVADWRAAEGLIRKAVETFGRLDALVNNAGVLRDRSLANFSEDDWDVSIRVNLKGTAAPLHHAGRYWRDLSKQTGAPVSAAVVNTSSASGLYSSIGQANYAAAKAGIASMSVVAARELGRYGVRVNAIAPVAATRLTDSVMSEALKARFDPTLVSPLVVYLLGPAAKDVTGKVFEIGGDAVVVVDTPRPVAGLRAPSGRWTAEALALAVPGLIERLPQPEMTAVEAGKYMKGLPLAPSEVERA